MIQGTWWKRSCFLWDKAPCVGSCYYFYYCISCTFCSSHLVLAMAFLIKTTLPSTLFPFQCRIAVRCIGKIPFTTPKSCLYQRGCVRRWADVLHPAHAGTWEQGALIQAGPYATGQLLPPEGRETLMETIGQLSGTVYKPASLWELPQRGEERQKKERPWFMRACSFVCLNNELTVGLADSPTAPHRPCALFPGPALASPERVHLSRQRAVMIARVKYHLHGGTKGRYRFMGGQTDGLYNSSSYRGFLFFLFPTAISF